MTDKFVIEETVGKDGKVVLQLPPDAPHGHIRITIEAVLPENEAEATPEPTDALDTKH